LGEREGVGRYAKYDSRLLNLKTCPEARLQGGKRQRWEGLGGGDRKREGEMQSESK